MSARAASRRVFQRGVTLMELLVVVTIVALLGAIGYPSYMDYVTRANRSQAKSLLLQIADRQEQFFGDNKRYAPDLTSLGFSVDAFSIDAQGAELGGASPDAIYAISIGNLSATTFTVSAAPQFRQAAHDTACGTLTLTQSGQKGQSGAGDGCW